MAHKDASKADTSKADAPKPDAPKPDAPKSDMISKPDVPAQDLLVPDSLALDQKVPDATIPKPTFSGLCSKDKWCFVNPLPQGNGYMGVWAHGPTDVFAVSGGQSRTTTASRSASCILRGGRLGHGSSQHRKRLEKNHHGDLLRHQRCVG